ncbi:MAG: carboxypeptidase regulatory-like domain-containing protein [Acidobacteria bacterium]|nr:carboxypeptidase regulatory-like domain-containing protein [Acidobacteriota bacterium]
MSRRLVSLLTLALAGAAMFGQDTRARVQGLVTDSTNAVVAGAAVTLRNEKTGVQSVQETNASGQYLFDLVLPGNYTITVSLSGFKQFVQRNILVQARGDVTVNGALEVGQTSESITVEASPVTVQFNTTTMALTLDTKMANSLPVMNRNPFLLVALNPAVVVNSTNEQSPYHHWAANQFDVGGNTDRKNDIILDGSPSMTTQKSSYTPPMDAVQEVNLQQNAVDAEFGHSAGGIISMQMKTGTNEFHGTAYYLGRNPAVNALADRITRGKNLTRQNVWGVTQGNPIKRNKLFNYVAYEGWRTNEPKSILYTLPTDLERGGDFSKSLNTQGNPRTIYDPYTTQTSGSVVTRQPFAGNIIPAGRFDNTSKKILGDLWKPNAPGSGPTGVNNFLAGYANRFKYWNLMDRADWNISDKLKIFGRYNQFRTFTKWDDFTGGALSQPVDGSKRHSLSFSGDAVYMLSPNTVLNVRGAFNAIIDSFGVPEATLKESDLDKFWPGNPWYKPYLADLPDIYYPGITVRAGSTTTLGKTGYWYQEPDSYNIESKMSKNVGRHYMKVGGEYRKEKVNAARPRPMSFDFRPDLTSNTYLSPNTALSGDGWASFLLGVVDQNSTISSIPIQRPRVDFVGFFFHDDIKLTQKLTLNVGVRYEFFTAMRDPEDRLSRFLDLTNPISEFQGAGAPALPAEAAALRSAPPIYNGAWVFTDSGNRGSWNTPKALFLPRAGLAWRINNTSALRVGFARYIVPSTLTTGLDILGSVPYPGFDATSNTLAALQGVPQQRLQDPFPAGLVPVTGKQFGRYTGLGGATTWYQQDFTPGVNDRFNVSLQRQLPGRVLADITFFTNIGRHHPYNWDLNQVDPRIGYRVGNQVTQSVRNPFFNLLPANKMPGQLRTQQNIAVSEMLRPRPQYGALVETLRGGIENRYRSLQMLFQRPFANGFNLVVGYNYNNSKNQEFYDVQDNYTQTLTWQPATNARHRLTGATIYQLPFGKGRKYMSSGRPMLEAVFGGWAASGLFTYNSGPYLRFGGALVDGDPGVAEPTSGRWFDTSKFKQLPPFTRRANPLQYDSVKGPRYVNLDATLSKEFPIAGERLKFELRGEAYNLLNAFTGANPDTGVTSVNFGKITTQRAGIFGRQIQFSGRFIW